MTIEAGQWPGRSAGLAVAKRLERVRDARRAWLAIDRNECALGFAQSLPGLLVLHGAFLALLGLGGHLSLASLALVAVTLALLALVPQRRWAILGLSGTLYFLLRPFRTSEAADFVHGTALAGSVLSQWPALAVQAGLAALFLALLYGALKLQRLWPKSAPARRPLLAMLALLGAAIAAGSALSPGTLPYALVWTMTLLLSSSFFFLAYIFADQKAGANTPDGVRLGFARPFWGGPGIPFKGPAFLARFEAKTPEALAATRLRAVKLALWSLILTAVGHVSGAGLYGVAGLPTLNELIAAHALGEAPNRALALLVLVKTFLLTLVWVGAFSHALVAVIRMAGFAIPRNMARPLTARSVAEFWNRYVYYFKEVLVDFFFYPAFARFFKHDTKLRIAFATFCAAFVGNVLFSVISQANLFATVGLPGVVSHFESYAFYALLLTIALVASQLRKTKPRPQDGWLRYDVLPRVTVIGLFCLLQIFCDESGTLGLSERLGFALHLAFV